MPNKIKLNDSQGTVDSERKDWLQISEAKTIASGEITYTLGGATLDTESAAASDDLETINPSSAQVGTVLFLNIASNARWVKVKHDVGNIWCHSGDILLKNIHHRLALFWDGTYWCVIMGSGGQSAAVTEVVPDSGENTICVVAARLRSYIQYVLDKVSAARSGGQIDVIDALTTAIKLAQPEAVQSEIIALAQTIVTTYADSTAIDGAFTSGVLDNAHCGLFCTHSEGSSTGEFSPTDIPLILTYLGYYSGVPYTIIASIVSILGADGLTRAVGLDEIDASPIDCESSCACNISFEFASASQTTQKGCTATVNVILSIDGGGTLPIDVDVDITTAGTGTGGGVDYTLTTATVTFPSGSGDGATQTVSVTIATGATTNDTVILGLDPQLGAVGDEDEHTITIAVAAGGDVTYDFTSDEHNATTDTTGTAWVSGEGWKKAAGSDAGASGNRVILPVFASVSPGTYVSIYVKISTSANTSLNFGWETAVLRRADNTLVDSGQWYGPYTAFSGTGENLTCWIQHANTVTTWIEAMRVVTDGLICGP